MASALGGATAAAGSDAHPDLCLEVSSALLPTGAWERVVEEVSGVVGSRSALFPEPAIVTTPDAAVVTSDGAWVRLVVDSGRIGAAPADASQSCGAPANEWLARFGRGFLEAGADRMLAEAPTTPGIDSDVQIEWFPEEPRLRTTLHFAGPFDIPNGTCWVDDVLSVDTATGSVVASGEQGLETSLLAEGACRRFFDHLPDGGAGEQAITLLPTEVALDDGSVLRFVATSVGLDDDAVTVAGTLESR